MRRLGRCKLVAAAAALGLAGGACNAISGVGDLDFVSPDAPACSREGPAPEQVPGDCKAVICASGTVSVVDDDADAPAPAGDCSIASCSKGAALQTPTPGAPCRWAGAAGVCNDSGLCDVVCTGAGDRSCDDGNACTIDSCDVGAQVCLHDPLDGVPPPGVTQTSGDCRFLLCLAGELASAIDDGDLPDDADPCTIDACDGGAPSNASAPAGTRCGPGAACDGAGQCVGCVAPADCGPADDCKQPTCEAGVCGFDYAPPGTPTTAQIPGDCQLVVCDGGGSTTSTADPGDGEPIAVTCDGSQCGPVLNDCGVIVSCGICSGTHPTCQANQCACADGSCVNGFVCVAGACACEGDGACGYGSCQKGLCACDAMPCTSGQTCVLAGGSPSCTCTGGSCP